MHQEAGVIVAGVLASGLLHVQFRDMYRRVGRILPAQFHLDCAIMFWLGGCDVHRNVRARDRMEGDQPQAVDILHRLYQLRGGARALYMSVALHVRLQTKGVDAL